MGGYVAAELRRLVIERAAGRCEYCRFHQSLALLPFEIEHIIAEVTVQRVYEHNAHCDEQRAILVSGWGVRRGFAALHTPPGWGV
jgi:hypothetical protein